MQGSSWLRIFRRISCLDLLSHSRSPGSTSVWLHITLGIQTQALNFVWQALYPLSHLPSILLLVEKKKVCVSLTCLKLTMYLRIITNLSLLEAGTTGICPVLVYATTFLVISRFCRCFSLQKATPCFIFCCFHICHVT